MSTATAHRPATPSAEPRAPLPARRGLRRAVDAEWTKLRSLKSTVWALLALVVTSVGTTGLLTFSVVGEVAEEGEEAAAFLLIGLMFGQVAALVIGTLVATSEYSSGMIRTTLAAVPRRGTVLAAKSIVVGGVLLVLGLITSFGSYLVSTSVLEIEGLGIGLGEPGVLRGIIGGGLYLGMLGIFGLAIGFLMRHTAAAITVGIALIFLLGNLTMLVPGAIGEWITKLMPGNAGIAVTAVVPFDPTMLDPWVGFAVFTAQTGLLLAAAAVLLSRRDA